MATHGSKAQPWALIKVNGTAKVQSAAWELCEPDRSANAWCWCCEWVWLSLPYFVGVFIYRTFRCTGIAHQRLYFAWTTGAQSVSCTPGVVGPERCEHSNNPKNMTWYVHIDLHIAYIYIYIHVYTVCIYIYIYFFYTLYIYVEYLYDLYVLYCTVCIYIYII